MTREFYPFKSIPRLRREVVITEKIDGTNASVVITEDDVYAQSRKRIITPQDDNHGFAAWVESNAADLRDVLGVGIHRGEWWGHGINAGYGMDRGRKRLSLFNTLKYRDMVDESKRRGILTELDVVPVLYSGVFSESAIDFALERLRVNGSVAKPGFMRPEGIVVYHMAAGQYFKVTLVGDDKPTWRKIGEYLKGFSWYASREGCYCSSLQ